MGRKGRGKDREGRKNMGVLRTALRRALLAMVPVAALIRALTEEAPGCL